ncbi:hypothetical protein Q5741_05920 [Paenibacillus sp. JX-17]|uniref:Uncharacterized protein n=1 Tax=Paenibacillus lacisoli TaxID=3064525 RepID=A0ABT9C9L6_9BACL|nr:hypothetical protein [Paenibacillus sp. JX-17]MDO7905955.1 hypothetical protein [Paenibacillus sp. JX-17]
MSNNNKWTKWIVGLSSVAVFSGIVGWASKDQEAQNTTALNETTNGSETADSNNGSNGGSGRNGHGRLHSDFDDSVGSSGEDTGSSRDPFSSGSSSPDSSFGGSSNGSSDSGSDLGQGDPFSSGSMRTHGS